MEETPERATDESDPRGRSSGIVGAHMSLGIPPVGGRTPKQQWMGIPGTNSEGVGDDIHTVEGVGGPPRSDLHDSMSPGVDEPEPQDSGEAITDLAEELQDSEEPSENILSKAPTGEGGFVPPPVLTAPVNEAFAAVGLPVQEWAAPDSVLEEADYPGLAIRAASLRGDAHRFRRESRQDSLVLCELPHSGGRAVLACVADGVGSQRMSHRGSAYACRLLTMTVRRHLEKLLDFRPGEEPDARPYEEIITEVAQGMRDLEVKEPALSGQISTTLTMALADLTPEGEPLHFLLISVGDSPVYRLRGGRIDVVPGEDDGSGIDSTATEALPSNFKHVEVRERTVNPGDMLLLCSDGLSNPMRDATVTEQLVEWWSGGHIPGRMEFGWQLDFQAKSYDDDRTAICLWVR